MFPSCVSFDFNSIGNGPTTVFPSILIQLENGPNEFFFSN